MDNKEQKRLGTLSIFIYNKENINKINTIISENSNIIISRMGIPYREKQAAIIVLILESTNEEVGAFSGKLGNIPGVTVKSAMLKTK